MSSVVDAVTDAIGDAIGAITGVIKDIPIVGPVLSPPKPKIPDITISPAPTEEQEVAPVDPEALANARDRALEAAKRANRRKFQIPLASTSQGSGLNIT